MRNLVDLWVVVKICRKLMKIYDDEDAKFYKMNEKHGTLLIVTLSIGPLGPMGW